MSLNCLATETNLNSYHNNGTLWRFFKVHLELQFIFLIHISLSLQCWCCREYRYIHDIRINSFLNVWASTIILVSPITFHRKQEISLLQNQVYQLPPSTTSSFCPYLGNYLHNQQIIAWTRDHAGLVVDIGRSLKRCDVSVHRNVASFQSSFRIKLISYCWNDGHLFQKYEMYMNIWKQLNWKTSF